MKAVNHYAYMQQFLKPQSTLLRSHESLHKGQNEAYMQVLYIHTLEIFLHLKMQSVMIVTEGTNNWSALLKKKN